MAKTIGFSPEMIERAKANRTCSKKDMDSLTYSICSYQGLRQEMEDAHCILPTIGSLKSRLLI